MVETLGEVEAQDQVAEIEAYAETVGSLGILEPQKLGVFPGKGLKRFVIEPGAGEIGSSWN